MDPWSKKYDCAYTIQVDAIGDVPKTHATMVNVQRH